MAFYCRATNGQLDRLVTGGMGGRLEHDDSKAVAHANAARKAGAARRCDPFAAYTGAAAEAYNDRMFPVPDIGRRVDAVDDANGVINTGAWGSPCSRKHHPDPGSAGRPPSPRQC